MSQFDKLLLRIFTIPQHDPIKAIYIEMVKEIVEKEEENEEKENR